MVINQKRRIRPTIADLLRGVAYSAVLSWTILFMVFPPTAYVSTLDVASRLFWLLTCALGALLAALGAFTRYDLKMELPGLLVMGIGPLCYAAANVFYVFNPPPPTFDSVSRIALSMYAIIPLLLTLPRLWELYSESQRAKNIRKEMGIKGGRK